jgi:hypothetical protein
VTAREPSELARVLADIERARKVVALSPGGATLEDAYADAARLLRALTLAFCEYAEHRATCGLNFNAACDCGLPAALEKWRLDDQD